MASYSLTQCRMAQDSQYGVQQTSESQKATQEVNMAATAVTLVESVSSESEEVPKMSASEAKRLYLERLRALKEQQEHSGDELEDFVGIDEAALASLSALKEVPKESDETDGALCDADEVQEPVDSSTKTGKSVSDLSGHKKRKTENKDDSYSGYNKALEAAKLKESTKTDSDDEDVSVDWGTSSNSSIDSDRSSSNSSIDSQKGISSEEGDVTEDEAPKKVSKISAESKNQAKASPGRVKFDFDSESAPAVADESKEDGKSRTWGSLSAVEKKSIFSDVLAHYEKNSSTEKLDESKLNNSSDLMSLIGAYADKYGVKMWSGGAGRPPDFTNASTKFQEWRRFFTLPNNSPDKPASKRKSLELSSDGKISGQGTMKTPVSSACEDLEETDSETVVKAKRSKKNAVASPEITIVHLKQCYKNICGVYEELNGKELSLESREMIKKLVGLDKVSSRSFLP